MQAPQQISPLPPATLVNAMHRERESPNPSGLPPEMAEFLKSQELAAFWWGTNLGTALVLKLPTPEIQSVRGDVPIQLSHLLYGHPRAPVIRSIVRIFDQPETHLAVEAYTNIAEEDQRRDFGQLAQQEEIALLFHDEQLQLQLAKRVQNLHPKDIVRIVLAAEELRQRIPADLYDFDAAKQTIIDTTSL